MPAPRQEVAAVSSRGGLFLIGGFDPQRQSSNLVFSYAAREWADGPNLPVRLDHPAAAATETSLYVAGGFTDGAAQAKVFMLTAGGWSARASLHHARGAHALLAIGEKLYVLGGSGPSGDVAAVEEYDPLTESWSDVANLAAPRNHVAGFVYRNLACIAGGRSPNVARVDCFDPATRAWSQLPDLPVPTSGAGATALLDEVIVAGGENAAESTLVRSVFRFNGKTWLTEPMLVPRHGIQLAVIFGRAWACGGATAPGYAATAQCTSIV